MNTSLSATASDIKIYWDNKTGGGEFVIENGDIALDNCLHSAVLVSLFTDRVAPLEPSLTEKKSEIGKVDGDRRGWWGDAYAEEPIGSRLWQLVRGIKADRSSILLSAQDMAIEALTWMVKDGIAASVDVKATWQEKNMIMLNVSIIEPQKNQPTVFLFSWVWEGV